MITNASNKILLTRKKSFTIVCAKPNNIVVLSGYMPDEKVSYWCDSLETYITTKLSKIYMQNTAAVIISVRLIGYRIIPFKIFMFLYHNKKPPEWRLFSLVHTIKVVYFKLNGGYLSVINSCEYAETLRLHLFTPTAKSKRLFG